MSPLADLTLVAWALVEVGVRVREGLQGKGRPDRDRATRVLIVMTLGAAIVAALGARSVAPTLRLPDPLRIAGVVVMGLGLALRVWAIAALGGAFRTTVEVEPGQTVVSTGPYRWIRHPSYAGLLLIVAGFGAALGNWLSLTACVVLPLPAIVWRIYEAVAQTGAACRRPGAVPTVGWQLGRGIPGSGGGGRELGGSRRSERAPEPQ